MSAVLATIPLQLACQLVITGSLSVTENGTLVPAASSSPSSMQIETSVPISIAVPALPPGYIAYPDVGAAYKIYNEILLWNDARKRCISDNGSLAVIDSVDKFNHVSSQRSSTGVTHVGIHNLFDDDEWVSVKTGFRLDTIPWSRGEPNGESHCVMIKHETGGLGNFNCGTALGDFVCEISIPEINRGEEEGPATLGQIVVS